MMNFIKRFVSWLDSVVNGDKNGVKEPEYQFNYDLDRDDNIVVSVLKNGNKVGEWSDGMLMSKSILTKLKGISIFNRYYDVSVYDYMCLIDGKCWKNLYDVRKMPNVVTWNNFIDVIFGVLFSEDEIRVYIKYTSEDHKELYGLDRIKFLMKNPIMDYNPFKDGVR